MKRFHVHVHVSDLAQSVAFYERLFGAAPAKVEPGYAKWMLDDPRLNFAISVRAGGTVGVDHLGFQADDAAELAQLRERAAAADAPVFDEGETTCCYARSDKHWVTDPQGVAWEQFHTLADVKVFSESGAASARAAAAGCCAGDSPRGKPVGVAVQGAPSASCC
jgi:lactoylglutathione lyase